MSTPAKVAQVGGSHYQGEVQHWDVMEKYDIEYLLATASKYLVRWRQKGGTEDLRKAISYVQRKMVESLLVRRFASPVDLHLLAEQYGLSEKETVVLLLLHSQENADLPRAVTVLEKILADAEREAYRFDTNDRTR